MTRGWTTNEMIDGWIDCGGGGRVCTTRVVLASLLFIHSFVCSLIRGGRSGGRRCVQFIRWNDVGMRASDDRPRKNQ